MPIVRKKVKCDFTTVHNAFLRDNKLGATARGVLLTMISMPENWKFSIKGLSAILPDGERKISTALKELENRGYLIRKRIYVNGKIAEWIYLFSDEPMEEDEEPDLPPDLTETEQPTKGDTQHPQVSKKDDIPAAEDVQNLDLQNVDQENVDQENGVYNQILYNQRLYNQVLYNQHPIHHSKTLTCISDSDRIDADRFETTQQSVLEQIEAEALLSEKNRKTGMLLYDAETIRELVNCITWVYVTPKTTLPICGDNLSTDIVRKEFQKLTCEHIAYVLDCIASTGAAIKNRRNYLLTCLYNAPTSMAGYYRNLAQHDFATQHSTENTETDKSPYAYGQFIANL